MESSRLEPDWGGRSQTREEIDEVQRQLGKIQYGIEESPEGKTLAKTWKLNKQKELLSKRARGISVSLDPALRVMIRPEGIGTMQLFAEGPVGPPNHPAIMNLGIMNDGSIADVYREHPEPPKVAIQPAVKVNVNLR